DTYNSQRLGEGRRRCSSTRRRGVRAGCSSRSERGATPGTPIGPARRDPKTPPRRPAPTAPNPRPTTSAHLAAPHLHYISRAQGIVAAPAAFVAWAVGRDSRPPIGEVHADRARRDPQRLPRTHQAAGGSQGTAPRTA